MWDDVIIGTGNKGNSATALRAFGVYRSGISHNAVSYWISDCYLDTGVTIFKDTDEGKALSKLLAENRPYPEVRDFLDDLVIRNLSPDKLKEKIGDAIEQARRDGSRERARLIRNALEIDD